ncbi:autoinducer binding domain-containing protein [Vibrio sagamiensis]|uniref:autoinducer binding domain-containing protein n=1 Tax=Vibrio sagamiensis TaxID=512650 RepID=UPI000A002587|nr:autoinducer binding domain-containing protein [Vibrio sagamiensis]
MDKEKHLSILSNDIKLITKNLGEDNNIDQLFSQINKELKCTYLTYMIETENFKVHFSSNDDWQKAFVKDKLINVCPIYRNAFEAIKSQKNFVFTLWDAVPHLKGEEQDLMDLRHSYNIGHGLGLAIRQGKFRESLVLAGDADNHKFSAQAVSNRAIIDSALSTFRKSILSNTPQIITKSMNFTY